MTPGSGRHSQCVDPAGSSLFISLIAVVACWSSSSRPPTVDGAVLQLISNPATNVKTTATQVVDQSRPRHRAKYEALGLASRARARP